MPLNTVMLLALAAVLAMWRGFYSPIGRPGLLPVTPAEEVAGAMSRRNLKRGPGEPMKNELGERFRAYVCGQESTEAGTARFRKFYE